MYKATSIEFHRNGVGGDPFTVVNLASDDTMLGGQRMVPTGQAYGWETVTAIVFELDLDADEENVAYSVERSSVYGGVAVIQPDDPGEKFRGDYWALGLRQMIAHYDDLLSGWLARQVADPQRNALAGLGTLVPEDESMAYKMASTTANGGR